jgi:hypothetical protein
MTGDKRAEVLMFYFLRRFVNAPFPGGSAASRLHFGPSSRQAGPGNEREAVDMYREGRRSALLVDALYLSVARYE